MGNKIQFGVKASKFLTPDMYDVTMGDIASDCAKIAAFAEQGLPVEDLSINEDGSTNPDFDAAACYALEALEQAADSVKSKSAKLRSAINNRPKVALGPARNPDLDDDEDDDEDEDEDDRASAPEPADLTRES